MVTIEMIEAVNNKTVQPSQANNTNVKIFDPTPVAVGNILPRKVKSYSMQWRLLLGHVLLFSGLNKSWTVNIRTWDLYVPLPLPRLEEIKLISKQNSLYIAMSYTIINIRRKKII